MLRHHMYVKVIHLNPVGGQPVKFHAMLLLRTYNAQSTVRSTGYSVADKGKKVSIPTGGDECNTVLRADTEHKCVYIHMYSMYASYM